MSRNVRRMNCPPEAVFRVLADGWVYPGWVVGASRMRNVDAAWPQPGAQLHHSAGVWPALLNDTTSSVTCDPPRQMVMTARGWPIGEARVTIDVKPFADGCLVRVQEEATSGPAKAIPPVLADVLLHWRNAETLHRLAYLAEGLPSTSSPTSSEA